MIKEYDNTAQSFVDALNMKLMPQLGYVLVKKDKGLFWESACTSYPANEETRKNTGLYRWAIVSDDKKLIQVAAAPIDPNKWAFDHGLEST